MKRKERKEADDRHKRFIRSDKTGMKERKRRRCRGVALREGVVRAEEEGGVAGEGDVRGRRSVCVTS